MAEVDNLLPSRATLFSDCLGKASLDDRDDLVLAGIVVLEFPHHAKWDLRPWFFALVVVELLVIIGDRH